MRQALKWFRFFFAFSVPTDLDRPRFSNNYSFLLYKLMFSFSVHDKIPFVSSMTIFALLNNISLCFEQSMLGNICKISFTWVIIASLCFQFIKAYIYSFLWRFRSFLGDSQWKFVKDIFFLVLNFFVNSLCPNPYMKSAFFHSKFV